MSSPKKRHLKDGDTEETWTPAQLLKKQKMDIIQGFLAQVETAAETRAVLARAGQIDANSRAKLINFLIDDEDEDGKSSHKGPG